MTTINPDRLAALNASPVLATYTIHLNDKWHDTQRQKLAPYLPRMVGTARDGQDEARSYMALDWLLRTHTPAWLDLAGLTTAAQKLRALRTIVDEATAKKATRVVQSAHDEADAAWYAAWSAARDAAGDAAGAAAWSAARDAARDAAWSAAWDAAGAAARDAAWSAMRPSVELLQASALNLLDRMIDPEAAS